MPVEISELQNEDRPWVRDRLCEAFGSPRVVSCGVLYQADALPGLVARYEGQIAGFLTYDIRLDSMEIVAVVSSVRGVGVGEALVESAANRAMHLGCRRLWLVTTNDNTPAQRCYERWGFVRVEVHRGAVHAAREMKPEIPPRGVDGVPIEDEWIYERRLEVSEAGAEAKGGGDEADSS